MVEAKNITKKFNDILALNNLSFSIGKQEIFGLVGPDGAGKSTLLRIIAGILKPTEGYVRINGKAPLLLKEKISYMPQNFGLYEDLTIEENLHFIGRLFGVTKRERERRIERLYKFSNLKPFRKRLAGRLSGGMKQKLGLMCALMHEPEVLLLDEPTNGVDPVSRREFFDILYELLKVGTTIILSTAYLDEAERCNRIGLIYNGNFLFYGNTIDIQNIVDENFVEFHVDDTFECEKIIREYTSIETFVRGNSIMFFTKDEEKDRKLITSLLKGKVIHDWSVKTPTLEDIFVKCIREIKS